MGCSVSAYLVRSDTVHNYDYEKWWSVRPFFPAVNGMSADYWAPDVDDYVGGLLWLLFDKLNLPKLRDGRDAWCVVELNKENIDILVDKTKEFIVLLLDVECVDDLKYTELEPLSYRFDTLLDDHVTLLSQLRSAKSVLSRYDGYSSVININY